MLIPFFSILFVILRGERIFYNATNLTCHKPYMPQTVCEMILVRLRRGGRSETRRSGVDTAERQSQSPSAVDAAMCGSAMKSIRR